MSGPGQVLLKPDFYPHSPAPSFSSLPLSLSHSLCCPFISLPKLRVCVCVGGLSIGALLLLSTPLHLSKDPMAELCYKIFAHEEQAAEGGAAGSQYTLHPPPSTASSIG